MGKSIGIWNDFRRGFAREIYNNRKEIGLFTLDDIEIDKEVIIEELFASDVCECNQCPNVNCFIEIAKAIADKKPIKIKE